VADHTHLVVVNDNPEFLAVMADLLHDQQYAVTIIDGDREDAVDLVEAAEPDGMIIDLRLGGDELHGWDVFQEIRGHGCLSELPTVVCSGDIEALADVQDRVTGMQRVAALKKPFSIDDLLASLESVLERKPAE
jgi:DNA-binding response OmpR family regulator